MSGIVPTVDTHRDNQEEVYMCGILRHNLFTVVTFARKSCRPLEYIPPHYTTFGELLHGLVHRLLKINRCDGLKCTILRRTSGNYKRG